MSKTFEQRVLDIVADTTHVEAYFFCETLYLGTEDPTIVANVLEALKVNHQTVDITHGTTGPGETYYEFS